MTVKGRLIGVPNPTFGTREGRFAVRSVAGGTEELIFIRDCSLNIITRNVRPNHPDHEACSGSFDEPGKSLKSRKSLLLGIS